MRLIRELDGFFSRFFGVRLIRANIRYMQRSLPAGAVADSLRDRIPADYILL